MTALFDALDQFHNALLIFTQPNADHQGRQINQKIKAYVLTNKNRAVFFPTGSKAYLTALFGRFASEILRGIIKAQVCKPPRSISGIDKKGAYKQVLW